jgi:tellurite resistance-related uncharacterized protein
MDSINRALHIYAYRKTDLTNRAITLYEFFDAHMARDHNVSDRWVVLKGVLHGMRTFVLQDDEGQTLGTHSISAGLDYPGVGPEHVWLMETGRAEYRAVTERQFLAQVEHPNIA